MDKKRLNLYRNKEWYVFRNVVFVNIVEYIIELCKTLCRDDKYEL